MANISKTVEIIFGGKNELSSVVGQIEAKMGTLNQSIGDATKPLADLFDSVVKVDAALLALAVGGLAYAYTKAVQFETSMVSFNKVSDGTPATLEAARKAAFDLSAQYGISSKSALDSSTEFLQAGFNVSESLKLTRQALDLSLAGEVTAVEASNFIVTTLKGFKAPAEDAGRLIDVLNEVSNKYATDVRQLALGMSDLSPIAKLMGLSFEETAGLLTPVIEVFGSGSESARGLRTGLLRLIDDSAPVADALAVLGVSQSDVNGKLRSGKDILLDVQKAFQGLEDPQKIFLAQQLAGIDQSAKMLEVFNGLNKTIEVTAVGMGAAGSAAKEVALRLESSQVQIDRFKFGFENLGIVVGEQFKTAATKAASGANAIMDALNGLVVSGAFAPLFDELSKMGNSIGEWLLKVAKAFPEAVKGLDFSGLLSELGRLGGSVGKLFSALFGDIDMTSADGLHKVIQGIIDAVTKLIAFTKGMADGLEPFFRAIGKGASGLDGFGTKAFETMGAVTSLGKAVNLLTEHTGILTGALALLSAKAMTGVIADMASLATKMGVSGSSFATLTGAASALIPVLGVGLAGAGGYALGSLLNQDEGVTKLSQGLLKLIDVNGNFFGAQTRTAEEMAKVDEAFNRAVKVHNLLTVATEKTGTTFESLPAIAKTAMSAVELETLGALEKIGKTVVIKIEPEFDASKYNKITEYLNKEGVWVNELVEIKLPGLKSKIDAAIPSDKVMKISLDIEALKKQLKDKSLTDEQKIKIRLNIDSLNKDLATAKKTIDTSLPGKKKIDVEVKMELEKLQEKTKVVTAMLKFKAEVDIANIKAGADILIATYKSVDTSITSTGTTLSSIIDSFAKSGGDWTIERILKDENARRQQSLDLQQKLIEQQIEMGDLKISKMKAGDSLIKVSADGLKPHLEMILWEILEAVQIRANESGSDFLLGVG